MGELGVGKCREEGCCSLCGRSWQGGVASSNPMKTAS
jgi:hypothetical protein